VAVRAADTNWVFFTRADYLLDFGMLAKCLAMAASHPLGWDGFVTADCYQLARDIGACDAQPWRETGPRILRQLPGSVANHTVVDTGVWMSTKAAFEKVGGLDEGLTAWGHAQTHFQWKLHKAGTQIVRIPEVLYYHPQHGGPRDLAAANEQLQAVTGVDVKELWKDYEGKHIYK
jgi:GT2 family glycosyltransferase